MQEAVYHDSDGRPYAVRDGLSVWLDGADTSSVEQLEYVGFGLRFSARIIDLVLTYAIAFVVGIVAVVGASVVGRQSLVGGSSATAPLSYIFSILAATAFYTVAEAIHGSTPGKMLLGLTVRAEGGGRCGFAQALKRSVAFWLDSLFFGLVALDSMRKGPHKQRIGDKWASTVVVKNRSLQPVHRSSGLRFLGATAAACATYAVGAALAMAF